MASSLTHWEPFAELAEMRSRFDRMLSELGEGHDRSWTPAIDVVRDNGNLVVRADVPGVRPDEIEISVTNDTLVVEGKHEETMEVDEAGFVRRERRYGAFSRSIALPKGVDPGKIEATTKDGVLELKVPLPKEADKEPVKIVPSAG
ncbi:MAG TPA: Hsp20/alpha crystallin family protein [Solirubrobacteraceae bacterium]|nr:Hsp20/alpha crystallin family protein [Solirubrobacteraceae bacterium]